VLLGKEGRRAASAAEEVARKRINVITQHLRKTTTIAHVFMSIFGVLKRSERATDTI
jgi:hypothetical protein